MKDQLISVIVPVYNAENYISNCIKSILNQTYQSFELILVDDGSKDRSCIICDEYARKDERIKVIHNENRGVTAARKCGVNLALHNMDGWITFIDADDTIPTDALQNLIEPTIRGVYDIVYGRLDTNLGYDFSELSPMDLSRLLIAHRTVDVAPFAKLFSKKIFSDNVFEIPRNINVGEDRLMNIRLSFKTSNKICFINKKVYNYEIHEDGCIANYQPSVEYDALYYRYLLESIPLEMQGQFKHEIIESCLNSLVSIARTAEYNTWKQTAYFKNLMTEIRRTGYHLSLKKKILLLLENRQWLFYYGRLLSFLKQIKFK